jgi:hypothetical protein
MQLARSIFERITAQAIIAMTTLEVSGAIAATLMGLLQTWREEHGLQPLRINRT